MDDKQTQDAAADATGGDGQTSDAAAGSDTGAQATAGSADTGKTFTQDEFNRGVEARLARERAKYEKQEALSKAELQAKLDEYEAAKVAAERAKLDETERAKLEAKEALEAAAAAKSELAAAQLSATRANLIAENAATLPAVYKAAITGPDAETITASIEAIKTQYEADAEAIRAGGKPPPQNLGAAGKVGSQPPPGGAPVWDDNDPSTHTPENWRKARGPRGVGAPVLP